MISLGSFKPEFFNANGDQANLEVLGMHLLWRGFECEVVTENLETADFVLIGDGSRAAMREFEDELIGLIPLLTQRLATGLPTLLVGSAHEYFPGKIAGLPLHRITERKSEFREVEHNGVQGFGYRNSNVQNDLLVSGAFVSTSLFGPVLAKSPQLLQIVLDRLGVEELLPEAISTELGVLLTEIRKRSSAG